MAAIALAPLDIDPLDDTALQACPQKYPDADYATQRRSSAKRPISKGDCHQERRQEVCLTHMFLILPRTQSPFVSSLAIPRVSLGG